VEVRLQRYDGQAGGEWTGVIDSSPLLLSTGGEGGGAQYRRSATTQHNSCRVCCWYILHGFHTAPTSEALLRHAHMTVNALTVEPSVISACLAAMGATALSSAAVTV
jgi:hypothetical protein